MPFKPGVSGNPNGRPKKDTPMLHALRKELQGQALTDWVKDIVQLSRKDASLAKFIIDKFDGKLPEAEKEVEDTDIILIL